MLNLGHKKFLVHQLPACQYGRVWRHALRLHLPRIKLKEAFLTRGGIHLNDTEQLLGRRLGEYEKVEVLSVSIHTNVCFNQTLGQTVLPSMYFPIIKFTVIYEFP